MKIARQNVKKCPNHFKHKRKVKTVQCHPSIHLLYPLNTSVGSRGAGAYPSGHRAKGGVHPGQVASPSQGHTETNKTHNHTRSHSLLRTILETPINLTCMFLDSGRKPENPERTHAYTGRTCKLRLYNAYTVITQLPCYSISAGSIQALKAQAVDPRQGDSQLCSLCSFG